MEIIAVDIGGTHTRFAIAGVAQGKVLSLSTPVIMRTADYPSLQDAWKVFTAALERPAPRHAGIAIACPVGGEILRMTNNRWVIRPSELAASLGLERCSLVNDFGAVAHALPHLEASQLLSLCGPDLPLPTEGVVSVVGPGTGLGVALLLRRKGRDQVVECEGGHIGFSPNDETDEAILHHLRSTYGRVSYERVVSGPGLAQIYNALAAIQGSEVKPVTEEKALWQAALEGRDANAVAALQRFCRHLGAFAGDIALAHGAGAVAIGGGLGARLAPVLATSEFARCFAAKGRFDRHMAQIPVKLIVHPEPGLCGAAAAYAQEHPS